MPNQQSKGSGFDRAPGRIAWSYAVVALLWIWLGDGILFWSGYSNAKVFISSGVKGTAFVVVTAVLLHWLVRREVATVKRSETLLRAVVEGTTDAVFVKDSEGRYLLFNEAAEALTGKSASEILGCDDTALFDPAEARRVIESDRAIMASGKAITLEEVLTSAGSQRTYHATKALFRDVAGNVAGTIGIARDITERKAAEDALRVSEKRYRELANAIPQIVWTAGSDGAITQLNSKAFEYSGLSSSDLTGWKWERIIHPEDRNAAAAAWQQTLEDGKPRPIEMRILRRDGEYRWHFARQLPVCGADGTIESWVGTCTDIDDLRRAEDALRETETRLREAQRIARLGSWNWEPSTGRVWWSDAEFELFGVVRQSVDPSFEAFLALLHPDDRSIAIARVESMLAGSDEFANDMRIIRPDGSTLWIHSRARATRDADGNIIRVEGTDQDITARRLAELALQESERRLRLALEAAGAIAFQWDIRNDTVTRYFSREPVLPVTGDHPGSLDTVRAQIHPEDLPSFDTRLSACLQQGSEYRTSYRVVRPDGTSTTLEEYGYFDHDADGAPTFLNGISIDVGDRVAATDALRESEARYRRLVAVLPTALLVHNGERVLYSNSAFVRLVGAETAEEILGRHPYEFLAPQHQPGILVSPEEKSNIGEPTSAAEIQLSRLDGRLVPAYRVSTPVTGYGPDAVLVALSDMTERERATQLLRSVLSSVSDAILTMNEAGAIGSANPAALRQFGYSDDELIGRKVSVLIPPKFRDQPERYLVCDNVGVGESELIGQRREVECVRRDGTHFPAELTVTEFSLDGHRNFTMVLRDITERKRLQTQFIHAQKMEAVGRLAGGVAHDFNNLLTIINGYCDLLLTTDLPAGDRRRDSVTPIRDAGERAAQLTQQLLAFSRKAVLEPRVIDLNELVSDFARLLRRLIGEDVLFTLVTSPKRLPVKVDPGQLEQVIMNLFVNARDAMPTGGRLTIETSMESSDDAVPVHSALLAVSDTGHGMSDLIKEKIFEPFFTTKGVGKGTGLGLAVVHGVISQFGGQISVESSEQTGTTFQIRLPLISDSPSGPGPDSIRIDARGSETVLLVEDDEAVRTIARLALQAQGYTVVEANGGAEAIHQAAQFQGEIHLLVSDVVMPEMGGRQLLDAVRQHRPGIRVLFMSGYTDDAVLMHGVVETRDAFIQKPFTPQGLARKVREVLHAQLG